MTQRTTGATPEQIDRAARRRYNVLMTGNGATPHMTGERETFDVDMRRHGVMRGIVESAADLVRPDERIVSVADLRALLESMYDSLAERGYDEDEMRSPLIDRITALLGDDV